MRPRQILFITAAVITSVTLLAMKGTNSPVQVSLAPTPNNLVPAVPAAPLLPHQRLLTDEEREKCSAEIATLADLKLDFAIATMKSGVSLAVISNADLVSARLLQNGDWEGKETLGAFASYDKFMAGKPRGTCKSPPCAERLFLDIGTNLGTWTFHAAQQGYHTISIEGMPTNFALLQLSKCLNPTLAPNINLVKNFVGKDAEYCQIMCDLSNVGDVMINCKDHEWTVEEKASYEEMLHTAGRKEFRLTPTMARKTDDVVAEALAAHPNLPNVFYGVKIDIEGSELMAMKGAPRLLAGEVAELPIIFSEVWGYLRDGPFTADVYFAHMRAAGYELRDPTCTTVLGPDQDQIIADRLVKKTQIENVCFIKLSGPAPVPVVVSVPPAPVPLPPLAPRERRLTDEERERCSAEISTLSDLRVDFGIATTTSGPSLAVIRNNDLVSFNLLTRGVWEGAETRKAFAAYDRLMKDQPRGTCKSPPCAERLFLDVGTNLGTWTFHAAQQGYDTISIEGMPSNFALLQLSKCLNPTLAPKINLVKNFVGKDAEYCLVVCDFSNIGDVALNCQDHEWTEEATQAYEDALHKGGKGEISLTPTMTRKMDDVLAEVLAAHPNFPDTFYGVKIDIEGSELMAARGAPRLLAGEVAKLPVIFSEIWYLIRGGPHPDAYFELMRAAGYELRDPTCSTVWGPEMDAVIMKRMEKGSYIENVCYVKL